MKDFKEFLFEFDGNVTKCAEMLKYTTLGGNRLYFIKINTVEYCGVIKEHLNSAEFIIWNPSNSKTDQYKIANNLELLERDDIETASIVTDKNMIKTDIPNTTDENIKIAVDKVIEVILITNHNLNKDSEEEKQEESVITSVATADETKHLVTEKILRAAAAIAVTAAAVGILKKLRK